MVWALLGSHVGKPSSAYGWSGGFSPSSPVFAYLWWTIGSISVKYSWKGRKSQIKMVALAAMLKYIFWTFSPEPMEVTCRSTVAKIVLIWNPRWPPPWKSILNFFPWTERPIDSNLSGNQVSDTGPSWPSCFLNSWANLSQISYEAYGMEKQSSNGLSHMTKSAAMVKTLQKSSPKPNCSINNGHSVMEKIAVFWLKF